MKNMSLAVLAIGCGAADGESWVPVARGDLALEVEVTGALRATHSAPLGPPSAVDEDFKIARMPAEGAEVKKGTKVLFFDTDELEHDLVQRKTERDSAAREIARKTNDLELQRREGELRVIEAEAAARRARLKADLPAQYTAAMEVRLAKIDLETAEAELRMARQRQAYSVKLGQAELAYLRDRHARVAQRTERLEQAIEMMAVAAPIDGVVVYRANWKGEKKKVGDPCFVAEPCLEVTGVGDVEAAGEVDEMESARVALGQRVRLRLDALPETEWLGQVGGLRPNVYRQSPRNPLKVIGIHIDLDRIDRSRMRPGMLFRGHLETGRLRGVVLAPLDAMFLRPEGPTVFRQTAAGWQKVRVELAARSPTQVEVRAGLAPGDRIARRDLEEGAW
jgi:HlyD family secretion protein